MGLAFLEHLARLRGDFTRAFRALTDRGLSGLVAELCATGDQALRDWGMMWDGETTAETRAEMGQANPVRIPRNHQVEAMIAAALSGDLSKFHALTHALAAPFTTARAAAT